MTQSKPKPQPRQILIFLELIMADINQTGCALKKCFDSKFCRVACYLSSINKIY